MNVIEKFLEKFHQCIILLSGFDKLHLNEYAKNLADNLNFELISFDYPSFDKLNGEITTSLRDKSTNHGIIIYGLSFPNEFLKFKPNIHISVSGSKALIDNDEKFNIYTENIKKNIINKFKNIKDLDYHDQVYEDIFNLCIDMIMKRVYGDRYEEVQKEYAKKAIAEKEVPKKKDESDETTETTETDETNKTEESIKSSPSIGGSDRKTKKSKRKNKNGRKGSKKTSKRGSKKTSKKVNRVIGTRLVMSLIKLKN